MFVVLTGTRPQLVLLYSLIIPYDTYILTCRTWLSAMACPQSTWPDNISNGCLDRGSSARSFTIGFFTIGFSGSLIIGQPR